MTDTPDIVERLRNECITRDAGGPSNYDTELTAMYREAAAEIERLRSENAQMRESAWLVEVVGQPSGWKPAYYVKGAGKRVEFSTGDADRAMRFARKEDAEAAIASLNLIGCEPREHMWPRAALAIKERG